MSSLAFIQNLQGLDFVIIFVVLLLLFGANRLPKLARGIGRSMGEFRKAREEFEDQLMKGESDSDSKVPKEYQSMAEKSVKQDDKSV